MAWSDYIDFDIEHIAEIFGEDAVEAIQEEVEGLLEEFQDAIKFADSKEERELAQESLEDFTFSESEAESLAYDYELEYLTEIMSNSYKDEEIINRYLELIGKPSEGEEKWSQRNEPDEETRIRINRTLDRLEEEGI